MKNNGSGLKRGIFGGLSGLSIALVSLIYLGIQYPSYLVFIGNTLWIVFFAVTIIFIALGILVIFGLKKEASKIIDIFLEGSLSILDVVAFIKLLYRQFIQTFKDFVSFLTPTLAILTAVTIYLAILTFYKWVGTNYNVAYVTVGLTILLVAVVGLLNQPKKMVNQNLDWFAKVSQRFERVFTDTFEIMLLLFFLTLDSTNLFFLPKSLNVALNAKIFDYDLMLRGFRVENHFKTTLTLVILAVVLEISRHLIKGVVTGVKHYQEIIISGGTRKSDMIKMAVRKTVGEGKDETLKFITFTTVLIFVFLLFPRLKLLAVVITSFTNLILDMVLTERLYVNRKGEDLLSRLFDKFFKF